MLVINTSSDNNLFFKLNDIILKNKLESLIIQKEKILKLSKIKHVVFFGSSASGKSTLEKILRQTFNNFSREKVNVPLRVVTRNPRKDDKDIVYVTENTFHTLISMGSLAMHGTKNMESGRIEYYGLLQPLTNTLPIYFTNNAIIKNPHTVHPPGFLENALLVLVYAPDSEREKRLRIRSPELFEGKLDEGIFRLSAGESSENFVSNAHIVVNNYGLHEERSKSDIIKFITNLLKVG